MLNDFYMVVSNSDTLDYFPNNIPSDFKVKPYTTLLLNKGTWEVALCELALNGVKGENRDKYLYILECDLCRESPVGGIQTQMLRTFSLAKKKYKFTETYGDRFYIPVNPGIYEKLRVYIRQQDRNSLTVVPGELIETTRCTLHFRKRK